MIVLNVAWLAREANTQIENSVDESMFIQSELWKLLPYETKEHIKKEAKLRSVKLVVGTDDL